MSAYVDPAGLAVRYEAVLRSLPPGTVDLDDDSLTVSTEGNLRLVYAPLDLIRPQAQLVLLGLTPGACQTSVAVAVARDVYAAGGDTLAAQLAAKQAAAFSGPIRRNLAAMLDGVSLPAHLGLASAMDLFGHPLVHTTSAVRYAVLRDGRNYSGSSPKLLASPMLRSMVLEILAPELAAIPSALVVPLGDRVNSCVEWLAMEGLIDRDRCLAGFPHPSGQNGHRVARYAAERDRLVRQVKEWFSR